MADKCRGGEKYFGSCDKLVEDGSCGLLQRVDDEREGTGAVSEVQQLLEEKHAVRALVGLSRRRHSAVLLGLR